MKHQINLYGVEFRPKRQWASLNQMVLLWGGLLMLMLGMGGWSSYQQQSLDKDKAGITAELARLRSESSRLDAELARHQPTPALTASLHTSRDKIAGMQLMLQQLDHLAPERGDSYARLMADLAGIQSEQLALERILVEAGRMSLSGQTSNSQHVPAWVNRFKEVPTLAGREFSELLLSRDKEGALRFQLGSLPKEKP